jgi:HlyD family secretion protein
MAARRHLGATLAALAGVAALAWGFWPRALPVETGTVGRAPLEVAVEEQGRTRVRDRFVVSVPVAGYLRRVSLDAGDAVAKEQTIAELEPLRSTVLDPRTRAESEARVASAEYALEAAQEQARAAAADAERAHAEHERRRRLCEQGCISEEELQTAELLARRTAAERRSADFRVEVARFELEAARTALGYSAAQPVGTAAERVTVRAPVAGRVLRVIRRSEGVVGAGDAILELGDPEALEIEVDVLSADAVRIAPGTVARLERWGGEGSLDARVRVVEPAGFTKVSALGVEEQRVWVIADITSPRERWTRLGDGFRVDAVFVLWSEPDVLQVPASALFRTAGGWAVYVVADGRAARRPVTVGQRNALAAQVLDGLQAGDEVILHPNNEVSDGVRVRRRDGDQ